MYKIPRKYSINVLKQLKELGNFHAIVGGNGMCKCGSDFGVCPEVLLKFIKKKMIYAYKQGYRQALRDRK